MTAFQTEPNDAITLGTLGRIVNFEAGNHEISNAPSKTDDIGLGVALSYDADGMLVAGGARFVGISADQSYINDPGVNSDGKATVKAGGDLPFVRKGTMAVIAPTGVTPAAEVRYITATGVLTTQATVSSVATTLIAGATWEAKATAGELVSIRLNS